MDDSKLRSTGRVSFQAVKRGLRQTAVLSLLLFSLGVLSPGAFAAATQAPPGQTQSIQALEDALYTMRYDQEGVEPRLGRLEQTVFGQPQLGKSVDERIRKLQEVMGTSLKPLSPTATAAPIQQTQPQQAGNNAPAQPQYQQAPQQQQQQAAYQQPVPGESDYPTVTEMEQKVFGKNYVGEDIAKRLDRLESQVFKGPQKGALADRMDNLRLIVLGDTGNDDGAGVATASDGTMYRYSGQPYYSQTTVPAQQSGRGGPRYGKYRQVNPGGGWSVNKGYNANNVPLDPGINGYQAASSAMSSPYSTPTNMRQPAPGSPNPGYANPIGGNGYQPDPNEVPVSNSGPYGNPQPYAQASGPMSADDMNAMNEVEKQVLGHTYPADPANARLDRLETKVFHATSPEMPNDERLQRVIAVAAANGTDPTPQSRAKSTFQTLLPIILTILPMILL